MSKFFPVSQKKNFPCVSEFFPVSKQNSLCFPCLEKEPNSLFSLCRGHPVCACLCEGVWRFFLYPLLMIMMIISKLMTDLDIRFIWQFQGVYTDETWVSKYPIINLTIWPRTLWNYPERNPWKSLIRCFHLPRRPTVLPLLLELPAVT